MIIKSLKFSLQGKKRLVAQEEGLSSKCLNLLLCLFMDILNETVQYGVPVWTNKTTVLNIC